jgi:predicted CXXCH cytochrome family protein
MKQLKAVLILSLFLLITPIYAFAKVTGPCVNCHTMHNSQNGALVFAEGPQLSLLNNTCIGCHSNPSGATYDLGGSITPVVYTTGGIGYDESLAGGNFYWVEALGDEYGHNAINNTDGVLTMAPGLSDKTGAIGCAGSCHYKLTQWECGAALPNTENTLGWAVSVAIHQRITKGDLLLPLQTKRTGGLGFLRGNITLSPDQIPRHEM